MEKKVKWMTQYAKLFVRAMKKIGRKDYKKLENLFRNRYMDHLCSEEFEEYKKFGTLPLEKIYAAITMAQICSEIGMSMEEIQNVWTDMHSGEKKLKGFWDNLFGSTKKSYEKLANYLENEARKHKTDESMTFEICERNEERFEVKVARCGYVEIFEKNGFKAFCKVFCEDTCCFGTMQISNLVDGNECYMKLMKGE